MFACDVPSVEKQHVACKLLGKSQIMKIVRKVRLMDRTEAEEV